MTADPVRFECADGVALVTLDQPPVNALNAAVRNRVIELFDAINDRDDVRAVVLTGAGRVFCAGADLKDRPSLSDAGSYGRHNRLVRETTNAIRECQKPVIAAVNGAALGAGFGLMVACDIYLASEAAVFGMPEINVGLAGGASTLRQVLGRSAMRRLLFTGQRISAADLHELGVIERPLPPDRLLPEAMALATEIAAKAPIAVRYAKQSCNMVELMPPRDAYRFEQGFTVELSKTEDAQEARRAFTEKRKPVFKGR